MRLNEIDGPDRLWASLSNIDLDLNTNPQQAIGRLKILVNMQNPQMNKMWLPKIEAVENNIIRIIETEFADDANTDILKQKAQEYIQEIRRLKSML